MDDRRVHLIGTYQMPPILGWSWDDDKRNIKRFGGNIVIFHASGSGELHK
jgi:hypothetical protein